MIKKLSLRNWKSFDSSELWVDPLIFIIGTNAAGKSNIVDALSFLSFTASGERISDFVKTKVRGGNEGLIKRHKDSCSLTMISTIGKDEYTYYMSVRLEENELRICEERLSVKYSNGSYAELYYTDPVDKNSMQITARFRKDKKGPRKGVAVRRDVTILSQVSNLNVLRDIKERSEQVATSLKSIFILDPKPERMRNFSPLNDHLLSDGSNLAGVIAALPIPEKEKFEEALTNFVKPLPEKDIVRIWAETVGRFHSDAMLYCTEEWTDGNETDFDARSMSDGTLRFISIITALLTAKEGSTIVIEEVDNGLHPSRAGELVEALHTIGQNRRLDIICTTHNPILIDALGPQMLPFISYVSRSTSTGASEIHLLEEAPHLLRNLARYTPGEMMTKGILSTNNEK